MVCAEFTLRNARRAISIFAARFLRLDLPACRAHTPARSSKKGSSRSENAEYPPICGKTTVGGHCLPSSRCRMKSFLVRLGISTQAALLILSVTPAPAVGAAAVALVVVVVGAVDVRVEDQLPGQIVGHGGICGAGKAAEQLGCLPASVPPAHRCRCRRRARRLRHAVRESPPVRRGPDHSSG